MGFHPRLTSPPTRPLSPVIPNNARHLCLTAAAGTELAVAYSQGTVIIFPCKRSLQPEGLHPPRGVAASGFRPLCKIPQAASRRSLDRVSVPVWPFVLLDRLPVIGLVGHYPPNYLIGRRFILKQIALFTTNISVRGLMRY